MFGVVFVGISLFMIWIIRFAWVRMIRPSEKRFYEVGFWHRRQLSAFRISETKNCSINKMSCRDWCNADGQNLCIASSLGWHLQSRRAFHFWHMMHVTPQPEGHTKFQRRHGMKLVDMQNDYSYFSSQKSDVGLTSKWVLPFYLDPSFTLHTSHRFC